MTQEWWQIVAEQKARESDRADAAREACESEVRSEKFDLKLEQLPEAVQLYIETLEQSLLDANNLTASGKRYKYCSCCNGVHDTTDGQHYDGKDFCMLCCDYRIGKILSRYNKDWE